MDRGNKKGLKELRRRRLVAWRRRYGGSAPGQQPGETPRHKGLFVEGRVGHFFSNEAKRGLHMAPGKGKAPKRRKKGGRK